MVHGEGYFYAGLLRGAGLYGAGLYGVGLHGADQQCAAFYTVPLASRLFTLCRLLLCLLHVAVL